jgi:hypothetical protein
VVHERNSSTHIRKLTTSSSQLAGAASDVSDYTRSDDCGVADIVESGAIRDVKAHRESVARCERYGQLARGDEVPCVVVVRNAAEPGRGAISKPVVVMVWRSLRPRRPY